MYKTYVSSAHYSINNNFYFQVVHLIYIYFITICVSFFFTESQGFDNLQLFTYKYNAFIAISLRRIRSQNNFIKNK